MNIRVLMIRHGQTPGNALHRYIGSTDQSLSPQGILALAQAPHYPGVKKVYTSPQLRARQTAALIFPLASQICCGDLREMDFGIFENRSPEEMENDREYTLWLKSNCLDKCPNGEDMASFAQRTCREFSRIIAQAIAAAENELYLVAHGGSMMAIMDKFTLDDVPYHYWMTDNGRGWLAELDPEKWQQEQKFLSWQKYIF